MSLVFKGLKYVYAEYLLTDFFFTATFRLVVFRPFVGEILIGWVSSCTEGGSECQNGVFDDIFIPKHLLFESCVL